jgi:hypothetical protein
VLAEFYAWNKKTKEDQMLFAFVRLAPTRAQHRIVTVIRCSIKLYDNDHILERMSNDEPTWFCTFIAQVTRYNPAVTVRVKRVHFV